MLLKESKLAWESLNTKKALNYLKLVRSFIHSRSSGKVKLEGMPAGISIEPTTSCNLRCPECPSGLRSFTRPTGMLTPELFYQTLDQLHENLLFLIFYFQGEPFLHRNLSEMITEASGRKIYTFVSTNGHYLDEENCEKTVHSGLSKIIISLDGASSASYEKYRVGGKFDQVIDGIKRLVDARKKLKAKNPLIVIQFLVMKHNEKEIEAAKKLAKFLEVDGIVFKTTQIYDFESGPELIPENSAFARYKRTIAGNYVIKNKLYNHCWKMWHSCVMTWDGKIVPCCFDKDAKYVMGDIKNTKFEEIWFGEEYNLFRQQILNNRKGIDICTNCTEGSKIFV